MSLVNYKLPQYTIYCVTCKVNRKMYIGQTVRAIWDRWGVHLNHARRFSLGLKSESGGYCSVTEDISKYGDEAFDLEVLEICFSQEEANKKEAWWIMEKKSVFPFGYNKSVGGKQYISEERMIQLKSHTNSFKKVTAIKDGKIIEFPNMKSFCSHIGISKHTLQRRMKIGVRHINGYDFKVEGGAA